MIVNHFQATFFIFHISQFLIVSAQHATSSATPWQCAAGKQNLSTIYPTLVFTHPSDNDNPKLIDHGSSGQIYLTKANQTLQALKRFHPSTPSTSIQLEYNIGNTLTHPNIVKTTSLTNENSTWTLQMEYIPFSLTDLMRHDLSLNQSWSFLEISCIWRQILDAVLYLHQTKNIAHRDLKLENIRISNTGVLKILDFGSASFLRDELTGDEIRGYDRVGTPAYLPPETYLSPNSLNSPSSSSSSLSNKSYDLQAADIWSLAILFSSIWIQKYPWEIPLIESDFDYARFRKDEEEGEEEEVTCKDDVDNEDDIIDESRDIEKEDEERDNKFPTGRASLLCLLPQSSRRIIGQMLSINPNKRAGIEEIYASSWMKSLEYELH
ncbi:MAG: hypothetical protein M1812_000628 [Candelaria pacifica]|nr:MAG: hypothetical protein M1812_000628 [Candelaria pacifica]